MAEKAKLPFQRFLDERELLASEEEEEEKKRPFQQFLIDQDKRIESEIKEAELTSQPLPPLDLPTEEDRESWRRGEEEDKARAAEWYGGVKGRDEEERESKHRENQLMFLEKYRGLEERHFDIRERHEKMSKVLPYRTERLRREGSERELKPELDKLFKEQKDFEAESGLGYYTFGLTLKQIQEEGFRDAKRQREAAPSKISPGKEPSLYQKFRRLESTRSLLGPEVGLLDYKPLGSKIDKLGFIPAMFEPVDEAKIVGDYFRVAPKKGRGDAASIGAALWNTAIGLVEVIGFSPGGVSTMGLGGGLAKAGKVGQMYEAERLLAAGEGAFSIDLARNAAEHAPGLMRDLDDPDLSGQEKAEAFFGEAALLVFSGMSGVKAKKNFKKKYGIEPDKIKTREQARIAYERFLDQTAVERLDPKLRRTPKQIREAQIEGLIKEMQDKVDRGEFRVPRPKPLEEGLRTPELKAEEPPTPVEAELTKADDGKVYVERRYDIEENPEKFTYEDEIADIYDKTVIEPVDNALFDAKLADNNLGFKELERRRTEIKEQQKKLQNQGVFEGPINDFNKGMTDKLVELMRDKGDAMERWEADHKPLYDQYYELEKQYKLLHQKWEYNSAIEEVLSREVLELQGLIRDFIPTEELPDTLYHVTLSQEVPSIMKEGILSGGGKSFKGLDITDPRVQAAVEEGKVGGLVKGGLLEKGGVHVFDSYDSALAWATRMDWEISGKHGSGKISIIPVTDKYSWSADPKLFAGQIGEGRALIRGAEVNPKSLGKPIVFDEAVMGEFSRARKAGEAPKPLAEGYLEPPATALEAMKRDAAAAEAGKELKTLEQKMEDIYPRGAAEGLPYKAELPEAMRKALEKKTPEKALEDSAKIEEKAEVVAAEEALEGKLLPFYMQFDKPNRHHKTVRRHLDMAVKEGDKETIAAFLENPDSAYEVVPTSRWAEVIDGLEKDTSGKVRPVQEVINDINSEITNLEKGDVSVVGVLLKRKKIDLLRRKWRESKDPADLKEYETNVQDLANNNTFLGQLVQANNYFKGGDPIAMGDLIEASIKKHTGKNLSTKEKADLIKLIDESSSTKEKADAAAEKYWEKETDENWKSAVEALDSSEVAMLNQIDFIANRTPKPVADMIVSALQGNFLTPTTLSVNIAGNVFPLAPRAMARGVARGLDFTQQVFMRNRRLAERDKLQAEQEVSPTTENAVRLEKLERMLGPMEQMRLSPLSGSGAKLMGLVESTGIKRLFSAIKKTRKEGGSFWEHYEKGRSGPLGADALSAMLLGDRINLYETGSLDMTNITPPVDAFAAGKRLLNTMQKKGDASNRVTMDTLEAVFGMSPTLFFRALSAGDIPFRQAEMRRLISEQAEIRGWDAAKKKRAMERPELMFGEKEYMRLKNEAARATFQQENWSTATTHEVNQFIREKLKDPGYVAWRSMTPYQKTLLNLTGELINFTPAGIIDVVRAARRDGFMSKDANLSAGKMMTGTMILGLAEYLLDNDLMSADLDPFMAEKGDTKKVRYMTEETYHHGFLNMSAISRSTSGEDTAWQQGDWLVDSRRLGPMGFLLLNNAHFYRALEKLPKEEREKLSGSWTKLLSKRVGEGIKHSARYSINQTFATGIRDKVRGIHQLVTEGESGKFTSDIVRDLLTIPLPNTLSWWQKADSPYRQTFKADGLTDALKSAWARKTGGWEEDYPIIVDLWGTPLESMPRGTVYPGGVAKHKDTAEGKIGTLDRLMATTFNIFKLKKSGAIIDPYSSEVYRLWRKFGKSEVVPPMASPKITLDGVEYKLNRDQYAYYSVLVGIYRLDGSEEFVEMRRRLRTRLKGVRQFVNEGRVLPNGRRQNYIDIPDEEKVKELKSIYGKASKNARKDFAMWTQGGGKLKPDAITRGFQINIDNLPLTDDQIVKDPSGRVN